MDLLITRFVRAIRDQEGKDINMVDQIKNYKQIFIEARAVGPRIGKYSLQPPLDAEDLREKLEIFKKNIGQEAEEAPPSS